MAASTRSGLIPDDFSDSEPEAQYMHGRGSESEDEVIGDGAYPSSDGRARGRNEEDLEGDEEQLDDEEEELVAIKDAEQQEEKQLDDDEDRKNPQYIPKKGTFYEHDDRTAAEEDGEDDVVEEERPEDKEKKEAAKKKMWKEDDSWTHDKFDPGDQEPKSKDELVASYGYDIRTEEGPPRARRRRRYGRGPNKYTRNWEDMDAYGKPIASRGARGGGRGRGRPHINSEEDFPSLAQNGHRRAPRNDYVDERSQQPRNKSPHTRNNNDRSSDLNTNDIRYMKDYQDVHTREPHHRGRGRGGPRGGRGNQARYNDGKHSPPGPSRGRYSPTEPSRGGHSPASSRGRGERGRSSHRGQYQQSSNFQHSKGQDLSEDMKNMRISSQRGDQSYKQKRGDKRSMVRTHESPKGMNKQSNATIPEPAHAKAKRYSTQRRGPNQDQSYQQSSGQYYDIEQSPDQDQFPPRNSTNNMMPAVTQPSHLMNVTPNIGGPAPAMGTTPPVGVNAFIPPEGMINYVAPPALVGTHPQAFPVPPFQTFPPVSQQVPTEVYRNGVTYYYTENQPQPRANAPLPKRPKAAIPIRPPSEKELSVEREENSDSNLAETEPQKEPGDQSVEQSADKDETVDKRNSDVQEPETPKTTAVEDVTPPVKIEESSTTKELSSLPKEEPSPLNTDESTTKSLTETVPVDGGPSIPVTTDLEKSEVPESTESAKLEQESLSAAEESVQQSQELQLPPASAEITTETKENPSNESEC